jgi:prolyl-tRNA synthetase
MIRAGMIRQVVAGAYAYLPLGYRVLRKIEAIVREEMDAAGAIELHMSAMQPLQLWRETGRDEAMGDTLIRLPDQTWRRGVVLGPTHEEIITDIVRHNVSSYKELPLNLYQIQTKFRDEQRPKSGVLRTREFLMKDAYSFDVDKEALDKSYDRMYDAYQRIYARCGLPYLVVEAESGPIGGDASHEFMVVSDGGEDLMVHCDACGYSANLERAECPKPAKLESEPSLEDLNEVHTPGMTTIEQIANFFGVTADRMIKTLVLENEAGEPIVACIRGDHELNVNKLTRAAGMGPLDMASEETVRRLTGAEVGFAGPHALPPSTRIVCDHAVANCRNAITGACKTDHHVTGLNPGRDFELGETHDIRTAVDGDGCSRCGEGRYAIQKCIEIGHVFKLGVKYSESMGANFLDANGKSTSIVMGCYGIGLNRIMAAAIEAAHDENGIVWPISIAPYQVEILALDVRQEEVMRTAEAIYNDLSAHGIEVLFDDRADRPGVKFKDADLIGIPIRVTIGKRGLSEGNVEIKLRGGDEVEKVPPAVSSDRIRQLVDRLQTPFVFQGSVS